VRLENETDFSKPQPAQITAQPALVINDVPVQAHPSAGRLGDAANHIPQRRLARSARPDQPNDLAGEYRHRDVNERINACRAFPEMLGYGTQFDQRGDIGEFGHRAITKANAHAICRPRCGAP
jgi:hypothetical protein